MNVQPIVYDLTLAWKWELDVDFIQRVEAAARERGLSVLQVVPKNLDEAIEKFSRGVTATRCFYDRASDEDERFLPLASSIERSASGNGSAPPFIINPRSKAQRASDKATMHMELLAAGIRVPNTLIAPPFSIDPAFVLADHDLKTLGTAFVIKPANTTGGGNGVIVGATTWKEVDQARKGLPQDKFLVQEIIKPAYLGDFRAWFRVYYSFRSAILCWWDDRTHVYEQVSAEDELYFGLDLLRRSVEKIHGICGLEFFSTEFCQSTGGEFVAVDYVNEICDMRLQSKAPNGVPDSIVTLVAQQLVGHFVATVSQSASP